ncbi:CYTH domain-containing protein [Flagellimonas sp. DF-77]|uniref:CYTH domain-containing protein n=1 Tax=Flagellimonas algarum TaxID=3230298 RepID=UPI00339A5D90
MEQLEIERKFLVKTKGYLETAISKTHIVQGFLNTHPERTVRIRIKGEKGFLTVKGKGNRSGTTRFEWEKELSKEEALPLLELCEPVFLEKIRYEVPSGRHTFEVDEFLKQNHGLVVAEIELESEGEPFEKPDWLGEEVTGQVKYYNSQLSKIPYSQWND